MFDLLKQEERSEKVRLYALTILANLALREQLRPQILATNGIEIFLGIVRQNDERFKSVEAQRVAAKGLVNLVSTKRELRLKIVTELGDQVRMIYRGEMDEIVGTYIQSLLHK